MRRMEPRRVAAVLGLVVVAWAGLTGAGPLGGKEGTPSGKKKADVPLKIDETVGDLAKVPPLSEIRVEGVGLVLGLDGTGSQAAPSGWRTKLLARMQKDRVQNAERWLDSPNTSLVLVKGKIPAGITTEDVFDVEVELDPSSTTTSLAGGQLLKAELFQVSFGSKGELLPEGQMFATVSGPVMTGTEAKPDDLRAGRILGGAKVKKDMPYALIINEKRKSFKTSALLQSIINTRFSRMKGIDQEGMAKAKTDQFLVLNVPTNYHHNQFRFFQVVENLPVVDTPPLRQARLQKWGADLLDPKTAGPAALRLEGVGRNASDTLKAGLANTHPQVRFFAAEALAYLGDEAGVTVLSDAIKERPEFRAYALAALAAMDHPAASLRLRELMAEPDVQVRYGAFNALRIIDKTDPFLGQVQVRRDEPEPDPEDADDMAMRIAAPRRKKPRRADPFDLYLVDCEGPPLVHVARTRRCEIVVFGKGQKLLTPAVLGSGQILVNAADGDEAVQISRIGDGTDEKVQTRSLALDEVIREAANLGATYPEILSLLQAAERQKNLPGPLVVDALPSSVSAYDEAQLAGRDATSKTDPAVERTGGEKPKAAKKSLINRMFRKTGK